VPPISITWQSRIKNGELTITLNFATDEPNAEKALIFGKEQISAAIILYCRNHSIPLPRTSRKVIAKGKDTVTMMINMRWPPKKEE